MKLVTGIFLGLLLSWNGLAGQTPLSLKRCLDLAVESNIQIRQAGNSVSMEEINQIRRKFDFLPSVNASASGSKNFGRTVDNFTQAIAQSPVTLNMNMGASLTLFRGFSKWNELRRAENTLKAAEYSLEDLKNDVRLNVALAYFQTIYAMDNKNIAQSNLDLLEKQMNRTNELVQAGARTEGDLLVVEAELASAKVAVVTGKNSYDRALMDLLLTLNLDPREDFSLIRPDIEDMVLEPEIRSPEAIFEYARINNPAIMEQEMRLLAAKYAMQSAKSAYYPTLSLNYGVYSFFSSNARPLDSIAFVNGEFMQFFGPTTAFGTQFNDNISHGISLSLNIPIFNNYAFRQADVNARLNYDNTILQYQFERNELMRAVMQASQDATAAQIQYEANEEQLMSLEKSLDYAQTRYDAGILDFYALREIINNKTRAELELNRAKYDYVLKRKILDLYEGKELRF